MKCFELTVTLLEDMHTGSGTGAGDFDALLSRDSRNLPMISASHWLGVWRYNLSRYLQSIGQSQDDCDNLFGKANNQRGKLTATALYSQDIELATLAWTAASRELYSREPKENTLRIKEFIPAGSHFKATLWLADDSLIPRLQRACQLTDTLGARRRRGDGQIQAALTEISETKAALSSSSFTTSSIRLLLRARDPICLPITGHPGNLIESECYIRGQVLRGALIAWLLRQNQPEVVRFWINKGIKVSNAYPLPIRDSHDTESFRKWDIVPMPLNINFPKPSGAGSDGLPWWAKNNDNLKSVNRFSETSTEEKLKRPVDGAFLFKDGIDNNWQSFTSSLAQRLRNSPPSVKHPDGALFAQEEIPENTLFLADIEFLDNTIAQNILPTLSLILSGQDCLTLGRGGAPVTVENWFYSPNRESVKLEAEPTTLTITLTSDLIARSPSLGFYESLTPQVLLDLCGLLADDFVDTEWQRKSFCDHIDVYGFNAMTGLPRLPVRAIRRGSTLKITRCPVEKIKQVLQTLQVTESLGERCTEGFGHFRLEFEPTIDNPPSKGFDYVENYEETLFYRAQETFLQAKKAKPTIESWPKLSQWQALRFNGLDEDKSLAKLIDMHRQRLKAKNNSDQIAWLKSGPNDKCWIDWLIEQLQAIEKPDHQRIFYRALLACVRRYLKIIEEETT